MRDWIREMHGHTSKIQSAIDDGRNDDAWRLVHEYQNWCVERINAQKYDKQSAGTLLSTTQNFFVQILKAEGKYRQALAHVIYEGVLDGRNLKAYPKQIKTIFNKCKFKETPVLTVLDHYDMLKRQPIVLAQDFRAIMKKVEEWK